MKENIDNFWHFIGNKNIVQYWQNCLQHKKIGHAYLFIGSAHLGKKYLISKISQSLLCVDPQELGVPCQKCLSCQQFIKKIHPDYYPLVAEDNKNGIGIEQVRQWQKSMFIKSYHGGYKIGLISGVDNMSEDAANAVLKTIEEPIGQTVIFLTGSEEDRILATIKSRSQIFRWQKVNPQLLINNFRDENGQNIVENRDLVYCADGRPGFMVKLLADKKRQQQQLDFIRLVADLILSPDLQKMQLLDELQKKNKDQNMSLEKIVSQTSTITRCLLWRKTVGFSPFDNILNNRSISWDQLLKLINKLQLIKEKRNYHQNQKLILEDLFLMT